MTSARTGTEHESSHRTLASSGRNTGYGAKETSESFRGQNAKSVDSNSIYHQKSKGAESQAAQAQ